MSLGLQLGLGLGTRLVIGSAFTPASLFAAGESGYWLDPSDFTTMWQDSQGVTPVTATGQTCGLILDKRIGTRTQVFDDANVTFSGTAGYAGRVSPGVYEYARDASGIGTVFFGGLTTGRTYLVSVQISAYAGSIPGITNIRTDYAYAGLGNTRPFTNSAGVFTFFFLADGAYFRITTGSLGAGGTISNVSILEVPGNHFLQATAGNRPIVQTDGTNRFLLFDGTDDGMQSAATINPGAVDKAQVFAGARKLSDAAIGEVVGSSTSPAGFNGSFFIRAPSILASANYQFRSRGTTANGAGYTNAAVAAPITNVLTGLADISGPSEALRVNGVVVASNTLTQGTGNYLTYTHYIGRTGGTTQPLNGRVYQMVMRFGANLTANQITQTETFVNSKTGAY